MTFISIRKGSLERKAIHIIRLALIILIVLATGYEPQFSSTAAPDLTITPITWNVLGLDSNDETVGPNTFPIGARICNTGDAATNAVATFDFDDAEDLFDSASYYINLRDGSYSSITLGDLAAGTPLIPTCIDVYFEAEITRDSNAYETYRGYSIELTADGGISLSTPTPRDLFVEYLISQSRNSTTQVKLGDELIPPGGTMVFMVGETYTIELTGSTATNGYEQIETFLHLPNTIFRILSVSTSYTAASTRVPSPSDKLYADSCLWENDLNSPNYRSCLDSGKNGGIVVVTYEVEIIGGAGTEDTLNSLIYDFSGSSYHYNSDFSSSARIYEIVGPSSVTIQKQFIPDRIEPAGISRLKITITNPTPSMIDGVNFTDTFPTSPYALVVASPPNASTVGCGSPSFNPIASAPTISFSDGTLAPDSSCIIYVDVTVPEVGDYVNTTGNLYINTDVDTGNTATDTLTASTAAACTPGQSMAEWFVPDTTTTNPPDTTGGLPTTQHARVDVATASLLLPANSSITTSFGGANDTTAWTSWGYKTVGLQHTDFVIDTSHFREVQMSFWELADSNGPDFVTVSYSDGGAFTPLTTFAVTNTWTAHSLDFTGWTSTGGNTTFRISGTDAKNDNTGADLHLDWITFTGCEALDPPPILDKAFAPATIPQNTETTLTFTLSNIDPAAEDLTGVTFTDMLPPGLEVADTPNAGTDCIGSPTWAPADGDTTLTFGSPDGATLAAGTSCTAWVDVLATSAGQFDNVSGFISATESGENSRPDGYAEATLIAVAPPIISKLFVTSPIFTSTTTTLRFTITNPNQSQALSGIAFSDTLPAGVTVATSSSSACGGGTFTTTSPDTISLSNASLAADSSCTIDLTVTGDTAGVWPNTTGTVTSTEGGGGNTASDTLDVRDVTPSISLLKLVSTSDTGPWQTSIAVSVGADVYYHFIVENTGDVAFNPISITDDTLDLSACNTAWVATTLPVAVAGNDNHIATCTVGPLAAVEGAHDNTAYATGTYGASPYSSDNSTATYATTALTIAKSVTQAYFTGSGETLDYSYLVTNSGYAELEGPVTIVDDQSGDEGCPEVTTVGDFDNWFDPGESITCTATYTTDGDDVSAGSVTNIAYASVDGVDSPADSETVPHLLPTITVDKTANPTSMNEPGGSVTFTVVVTNTSPESLTLTSLIDDLHGGLNGQGTCSVPQALDASGASNDVYSCSFTATIAGNAGDSETDTLTASAVDGDSNSATDVDSATVTITDVPSSATLTKTADPLTVAEPGGTVTFSVRVDNTSAVDDLTLTALNDDIYGDLNGQGTCSVPQTIAAGGFYECSFDGAVSGNAGDSQTDTVTATLNDDDGSTLNPFDDATVTITDVPSSATLIKTADPTSVNEPGGTVTFSVRVDNTSAVDDLTLTVLDDNVYGDLNGQGTCSVPQTIAAGGFYECSFDAAVSGNVGDSQTDTVTATLNDNDGSTLNPSDDATVTVTIGLPTITVDKTAAPLTVAEPGGSVTFTVVVTNTSPESVTLNSLVDDIHGDLNGQGSCSVPQTLDASGGADDDYSCSFSVAVNGNAGDSATDTVTASADDDEANTATASDSATVTVTDVPSSATLTKTANPLTVDEPGGTVTFSVRVDNTSAVDDLTLTALIDDVYGDLNSQGTCSVPQTIAAGGFYECSFDAPVSGNAGESQTDTIIATLNDDDGSTLNPGDEATVTITDVPSSATLTKTADPLTVAEPGGTVTFTVRVDNTSSADELTLTLTASADGGSEAFAFQNILLEDTLTDFEAFDMVGSASQNLISFTDDPVIPFTSANDGFNKFQRGVSAAIPYGLLDDSSCGFPADNLGIIQCGNIDEFFGVIDAINTDNTGPVTATWVFDISGATDLTLSIDMAAMGDFEASDSFVWNYQIDAGPVQTAFSGAIDPLLPSWIYTLESGAEYTLRDPLVAYDPPFFLFPLENRLETFTTVLGGTASELTLTALIDDIYGDLNGQGTCSVPQTIPAGGFYECSFDGAVSGNAGESRTDTITATLTDNYGFTLNPSDDASVMLTNPALALEKTGTLNDDDGVPGVSAGDSIDYSLVVANAGDVDLTNVVVTDPLIPAPAISCPGGNPIPILVVGAFETCTANYIVTQADINAGQVNNTAIADSDQTEPITDDETVPLAQNPAMTIEKLVSDDESTWVDQIWVNVGDTVYFRIRIENTGNMTLTGLDIVDGILGCTLGSKTDVAGDDDNDFEVGEVWQYTCDVTADAGIQTNTATANTDQTAEVSDDATYVGGSIFDPPNGTKTVNGLGQQVLRWTMVWINNTNDTALNVTVSDPIPANSTYDPTGSSSGYLVPIGAPAGSTNTGVSCTDSSVITDTTACYYEGPTGLYPRGRIVWTGILGPDLGASNAVEALHEILISFDIIVDDGVLASLNVATLNADLNGDGDFDDPGERPSASADAEWEGEPELPPTGFAPDQVTILDESQRQTYAAISQLELEIPSLGIRIPIVWIPSSGTSWDVTWLGNEAGLLQGTAYPGWAGNSAMAGHLYLPSGAPGPFADLTSLRWGDEIVVHAHGLRHTYMVLEREYVLPDDNSVLRHEEYPWLTLITCHDYDETRETFNYRYVVRAVKIRVEAE